MGDTGPCFFSVKVSSLFFSKQLCQRVGGTNYDTLILCFYIVALKPSLDELRDDEPVYCAVAGIQLGPGLDLRDNADDGGRRELNSVFQGFEFPET